ncbi:hypothetical protein [Pseudomonas sp. NBRC 111118]|uniref:DUF6988 family protein n=1 Tax=Pseudomonas sp. NBRC 111118 TaxID=1661033 RepID=UPI0006D3E38C|nr:hypothetical protein [Pseudomonas sp. NBRC 111118]
MVEKTQLDRARSRAFEIAEALHGRHINTDLRSKLCAACFAISQQHHNSILILLSCNPPLQASAFALLRPLVESTIRGLWLCHVATDEAVESYVHSGTKLDMASMLMAVGKAVDVDAHGAIYQHWGALSAYAHTGEHQVQRWLLTENIEPNYTESELAELVKLSGLVAEMGLQTVLSTLSVK